MPVLRSEQGRHATKEGSIGFALGRACSVESYSTGVPNVGFALLRLNLNVAGKLHTLQRPGAACVALGPVPNVALVVCVLTHETDVACVASGPAPDVGFALLRLNLNVAVCLF